LVIENKTSINSVFSYFSYLLTLNNHNNNNHNNKMISSSSSSSSSNSDDEADEAAEAAQKRRHREDEILEDKRGTKMGPSNRAKRISFDHEIVLYSIQRDFFALPQFNDDRPLMGSDFKLMFRMSRSRFQHLMEDVMARDIKFYKVPSTLVKSAVTSLEARLLLPLKALAYGVPAQAFRDDFQNSKKLIMF
jgi:hypothetical protein